MTTALAEPLMILRCICGRKLAVVPASLADKGIEIKCSRCGKVTRFD